MRESPSTPQLPESARTELMLGLYDELDRLKARRSLWLPSVVLFAIAVVLFFAIPGPLTGAGVAVLSGLVMAGLGCLYVELKRSSEIRRLERTIGRESDGGPSLPRAPGRE